MESELSSVFQVKVVTKNIVLKLSRDPAPSCFGSGVPLFEETYKFSEPNFKKQSTRGVLLKRCSCARVSFSIRLLVLACNFIKKETLAPMFLL